MLKSLNIAIRPRATCIENIPDMNIIGNIEQREEEEVGKLPMEAKVPRLELRSKLELSMEDHWFKYRVSSVCDVLPSSGSLSIFTVVCPSHLSIPP